MHYLRPIPRRLLPDDMLVFPSDGVGGFEACKMVRHVRFVRSDDVIDDEPHRDSSVTGKVYVDAVNSKGAFEVPAGSKVLINAEPRMMVRSCKRCCVVRGQVHHWELEVS